MNFKFPTFVITNAFTEFPMNFAKGIFNYGAPFKISPLLIDIVDDANKRSNQIYVSLDFEIICRVFEWNVGV